MEPILDCFANHRYYTQPLLLKRLLRKVTSFLFLLNYWKYQLVAAFSWTLLKQLVSWYLHLFLKQIQTAKTKPCRKDQYFFTLFLVGNAIQAFGNGTDVGVWQPQPPIQPTVDLSITRKGKAQTNNALDALTDMTKLDLDGNSLYQICGTLQVKFLFEYGLYLLSPHQHSCYIWN